MNKSVVILGTGNTLSMFDCSEHNGSEIWAVGSAFKILDNTDISIDKYFCLHKNETLDFDGAIIDQTNYPLASVVEKFDSRFFTNSISYMIAYALYLGFKKISLYGVDMDSGSEYTFERPSVSYWLGFARGLSVEVSISSNIDSPIFLYGFEDYSLLIEKLKERSNMSKQMAEQCQKIGEDTRAQQYLGQQYDNDYWIRELRG